ncbi:hypothetical protein [Microbacterium sp. LCT-H2]|uniref:hypothetical protein n=1 Tax=Microbacterium sp. LCT-H2 TaxID=1914306 RepID=UPI0008F4AB73|nr:hypothetical protein [Microbacterium sp. LCT-H2]OIJ29370.1 hypothetical protein BK819_15795 [Microbacterium sp. LCT-H2]
MSTLDLLTDTFPHGTPDGYRLGCRTIACPAALPCRDVHTRYCGDFAFAKLIDAGVPLPEILERDAAAKEGIRQRDKIAAREERRAAAHPKVARPRSRAAVKASPQAATPTGQRRTPPAPPQRPHPGYKWLAQATEAIAQLPTDLQPRRRDDLAQYRSELDRHVAELEQWRQRRAIAREQLTAAAAALKTATIASRAGLSVNGAIENALNTATDQHRAATEALASIDQERPAAPTKPRAPRPRRAPRQLQPHGTNACRARGCDRPECIEAGREYHRLWMRRRRAEGIPLEHHGTAYGYQLGCKDRETCPAEISCADASLAEERRRRREAGITEQAPRVPAEPVREHVRQLMACGMTVLGIAEKANVSKTGVKILLYGRSGARKGELPREIEEAKAQRILALQPADTALAISA